MTAPILIDLKVQSYQSPFLHSFLLPSAKNNAVVRILYLIIITRNLLKYNYWFLLTDILILVFLTSNPGGLHVGQVLGYSNCLTYYHQEGD